MLALSTCCGGTGPSKRRPGQVLVGVSGAGEDVRGEGGGGVGYPGPPRCGIGEGEESPDPSGDGVFGHGWVHHSAECLQGHLTVGDP